MSPTKLVFLCYNKSWHRVLCRLYTGWCHSLHKGWQNSEQLCMWAGISGKGERTASWLSHLNTPTHPSHSCLWAKDSRQAECLQRGQSTPYKPRSNDLYLASLLLPPGCPSARSQERLWRRTITQGEQPAGREQLQKPISAVYLLGKLFPSEPISRHSLRRCNMQLHFLGGARQNRMLIWHWFKYKPDL